MPQTPEEKLAALPLGSPLLAGLVQSAIDGSKDWSEPFPQNNGGLLTYVMALRIHLAISTQLLEVAGLKEPTAFLESLPQLVEFTKEAGTVFMQAGGDAKALAAVKQYLNSKEILNSKEKGAN